MKMALFCITFIISSACPGQSKQYLYYFDKDLNSTKKEKAIFKGLGSYVNGSFEISVYNTSQKNIVWIQHFTDSSLQQSEGIFQSYYANGTMESEGNYLKGNEDGLWQKWDSSGHVIDSSFYENSKTAKYIHRGYYKSGYPDSVIINDVTKNELSKIYYSDSGKITNEVYFTGEKGLRKFYDKEGVFKSTDSVFSREEIEAGFPGGAIAWSKYIVSGLQRYADEVLRDNIYGTCIVKFIIDKNGKVIEVEATTLKDSKLAEIGVRIIKNSPKWNPASQYGRKVNAYRLQPVTLSAP
jgi:antitoxin component YwqK of YwqJK toxin-antitoxin module